jgi:hypothetical protein
MQDDRPKTILDTLFARVRRVLKSGILCEEEGWSGKTFVYL